MSIPYTKDIPAANNNPSNDQPNMEINTNSINDIIAIDHVTFNASGSGVVSGQHQHVTFGFDQPVPGLATSSTQIYPKTFGSGTQYLETYASINPSTNVQINGYLPLVKAMGKFVVPAVNGACALVTTDTLHFNLLSVSVVFSFGIATFTVTLNTALPYSTYYVLTDGTTASAVAGGGISVFNKTNNTFQLICSSAGYNTNAVIGFMVI